MDQGTAFRLYKEGEPVSLIIDGRRVDGVMVTGQHVSSSGPASLDLYLPTPIGEPEGGSGCAWIRSRSRRRSNDCRYGVQTGQTSNPAERWGGHLGSP